MQRLKALTLSMIFLLWIVGCNDDQHHMMNAGNPDNISDHSPETALAPNAAPTVAPDIIQMFPNDGSLNHDIGTNIMIVFNVPMETSTFAQNFHLVGGDEMFGWMDSLESCMSDSGMMGGGMCGGGMMDMDEMMEDMMEYMDSIDCPGDFEWNEDMDTCIFHPTSPLMPGMGYMIFIHGEMYSQDGMMMNMSDMEYNAYSTHFETGNYGIKENIFTD